MNITNAWNDVSNNETAYYIIYMLITYYYYILSVKEQYRLCTFLNLQINWYDKWENKNGRFD